MAKAVRRYGGFLLFATFVVFLMTAILVYDKAAEAQTPPPITFSESCTTTLTLASAPNGLAGFTIRIDVPVTSAITTSEITINETTFPLQSILPPQSMNVSGVDLGARIEAGAVGVVLFSVSPCIDRAVIMRLDDDGGNPIVPSGTEVFP